MARITVEDCIDKFPSRFELVLVASNRARKLHSGENPTVEKDNDKNTVIALREIAQETITVEEFKNDLIEEYQTATFTEEENLEELDETSNQIDEKKENLIEDISLSDTNSEIENELVEENTSEIKETIEEVSETNDPNLQENEN